MQRDHPSMASESTPPMRLALEITPKLPRLEREMTSGQSGACLLMAVLQLFVIEQVMA
jgi:hypothetical protein